MKLPSTTYASFQTTMVVSTMAARISTTPPTAPPTTAPMLPPETGDGVADVAEVGEVVVGKRKEKKKVHSLLKRLVVKNDLASLAPRPHLVRTCISLLV